MWVQAWMVESVASLAATVEEPQSVVQLKVWGRKACTRVVSTTHALGKWGGNHAYGLV